MNDMPSPSSNEMEKETVTFTDIFRIDDGLGKEKDFAGIKYANESLSIYLPRGLGQNLKKYLDDARLMKANEDVESELKEDFFLLLKVLDDESLMKEISLQNPDFKMFRDFPMKAYTDILDYFLNNGYFVEATSEYKKSSGGKINWGRTIKMINPQLIEEGGNSYNIVYLDYIARKVNYRDDDLLSRIYKFCVHNAAEKIGPLYDILPSDVEEPDLEPNYDLFLEIIQSKMANTFNDKHLELFKTMEQIVGFLAGKSFFNTEKPTEAAYGVNTFAPVWEKMVDKIFGTVSRKCKHDEYYPHLHYVGFKSKNLDGDEYRDEDEDEYADVRSALRPDTIMLCNNECRAEETFILDSKYYRYGLFDADNAMKYLPGSESVCKQMAYAEYVTKEKNTGKVFNAFIMPYCADADKWGEASAKFTKKGLFKMCRTGYIYGNWKEVNGDILKKHPYHKIHCILLDMKSVMKSYTPSMDAQNDLADLIDPIENL